MEFKNLKKVVRENRTETLTGLALLDARQEMGFTGTLALLDEMMEETEEEKSRRRTALKYTYFRTMTPHGNI